MPTMTVVSYILRDVHFDANDQERQRHLLFEDFQKDPELSGRLISTVWMAYNSYDGLLYCGLTAFNNDILYTFDLDTKEFRSLGFQSVAERFDVKIHRSLAIDGNGVVYGATAGLHDLDQRAEAKGGKIFRYDPRAGEIEILGIPLPPDYIQCVALDKQRKIIYGFTYPVAHAFRFDITSRTSRNLGYIGSLPHSPVIDDDGNLWGTWGGTWATEVGAEVCNNLFKYDPDPDKMTWYQVSLPSLYPGDAAELDSAVNGSDGYIYIGTRAGALVRLDPESVEVKYLGRPLARPRIPGLIVGKDGLIYGCGGDDYDTHLFAYDRDTAHFFDLGPIYDSERKTSPFLTHVICEPRPGLFYVGETDNPDRSGYLWECKVEL